MNTNRIIEMEQRLERAQLAMEAMEVALQQYTAVQEDIAVLNTYLGSTDWHTDRADDDAGRLPKDLKRGVLSEDGIWNILERNRELKAQLKMIP